jgi:hypothetical protein
MPRELPVTNAFFPTKLKLGTSDSMSDDSGVPEVALPVDISSTPNRKKGGE